LEGIPFGRWRRCSAVEESQLYFLVAPCHQSKAPASNIPLLNYKSKVTQPSPRHQPKKEEASSFPFFHRKTAQLSNFTTVPWNFTPYATWDALRLEAPNTSNFEPEMVSIFSMIEISLIIR
jgi:hypothetical protein